MTPSLEFPTLLTDVDLIVRLRALARDERRATVQLIAGLAEFERRQLYFAQGFPSLFTYCTDVLHFSEHAAYTRMEVARTALRFPLVLERLEDGSVTLTAVRRLGAVLTEANHREVLAAAMHKKKGDIELLVATLRPRPDAATIVRKLPAPRVAGLAIQPSAAAVTSPAVSPTVTPAAEAAGIDAASAASPSPPPTVSPLAAERYLIQFTASRAMHDKLRLVQALIRHRIPTGDPAAIFERGLDLLLAELSRTKFGAAARPRNQPTPTAHSRHIPAAIKREVWKRDNGQCAFEGVEGRCPERAFLEFHHVVPFGKGGPATAGNIQLRCRAHNTYEAVQVFGPLLAREVAPAYSPASDG